VFEAYTHALWKKQAQMIGMTLIAM
jgi:hypothetical protein